MEEDISLYVKAKLNFMLKKKKIQRKCFLKISECTMLSTHSDMIYLRLTYFKRDKVFFLYALSLIAMQKNYRNITLDTLIIIFLTE